MDITENIIIWYSENKRNLPWRSTKEAYKIWLSEIILQQTRIEQGLSYYNKFIREFENIYELANAPEDKILRMWQGLGYYSRARNLHIAAQQIVTEYGGKFPDSHKALLNLKGVGDYTAAAIASIAFGEPAPVVDGNVKRVVARLFGLVEDITNQKTYRKIRNICAKLMKDKEPGTFNQAMMEFGALHCKPKNPDCLNCPLNQYCMAFQKNIVMELPIKYKKQKKRNRYFNFFIFQPGNHTDKLTFIEQRKKNDIWQKLYQFPLVEANKLLDKEMAIEKAHHLIPGNLITLVYASEEFKHILSHQNIYARFFHFKTNPGITNIPDLWIKIPHSKLDNYAIPVLLEHYLESLNHQ